MKTGRQYYIFVGWKKLGDAVARAFQQNEANEDVIKNWADEFQDMVNAGMEQIGHQSSATSEVGTFITLEDQTSPSAWLVGPELKKQLRHMDAVLDFLSRPSIARDQVALSALPSNHILIETFIPEAVSRRSKILEEPTTAIHSLQKWIEGALQRQTMIERAINARTSTAWAILYFRLLKRICEESGVKPTIGWTSDGKPNGRVFLLANKTQELLPEALKSKKETALCSKLIDARRKEKSTLSET